MTYMAAYLNDRGEQHLKTTKPKPYEYTVGPGVEGRYDDGRKIGQATANSGLHVNDTWPSL